MSKEIHIPPHKKDHEQISNVITPTIIEKFAPEIGSCWGSIAAYFDLEESSVRDKLVKPYTELDCAKKFLQLIADENCKYSLLILRFALYDLQKSVKCTNLENLIQ